MDAMHGSSELIAYKQFRIIWILKPPCPGHSRRHMRLSDLQSRNAPPPHTQSAQGSSAWASTAFNASCCKSGEHQILIPLSACEE
jgi:hypothetical protein